NLPPDDRLCTPVSRGNLSIPGHSGSIPMQACTPWLKAVMYAPNLYADSILTKLHQLRAPAATTVPATAVPGQTASTGPDPEDLRLADAVAQWQLQQRA
ncbi:hypothetical protein, partial [Methylibium petroleiphilum]